jgi:protein-disulfide isomerase
MNKLFVLPLAGAVLALAFAQKPVPAKKADGQHAVSPAPGGKSALDKTVMESYVRHLFVMGPAVKVQVDDPKPASLMGFVEVNVHASSGPASQDFLFYVAKDGQKIVQGNVYDINQNPFKNEIDKLNTGLQPSLGTPGAPVVLVEFSDFQCPFCKEEAKMLRENLVNAYPKQVRLYFKDFPLEQLHPWARAGAIAGRCVFRQSPTAFWAFHDWVYDHQAEITPGNLKDKVLEFAKGKDIDVLQLGRCLDSKATEAEVNKNIVDGKALNLNSTPTLFVNGRRLVGRVDWPSLRSIIDYEIEYQKTARNAGEDCGCELKLPGLAGSQ